MTGPVSHDIWRAMSIGERIEHLLGRSLDEARAILDADHSDPRLPHHWQSKTRDAKLQVINTVLRVATKAGIEGRRLAAQRDQVFEGMQREYRELQGGAIGNCAVGGDREPRP